MKNYDLVIPVFKEKKIVNLLDYLFKNTSNIDKIMDGSITTFIRSYLLNEMESNNE